MHGDFLKETLIRAGINTDNLIQDESIYHAAFVSLKETGSANLPLRGSRGQIRICA